MKVSIFGMGYVGSVTAACLAHIGNHVVCVEVVEEKIQSLLQGKWPIYEQGLDELCQKDEHQRFINIEVTSKGEQAVLATDLSLICVGTPNLPDGRVDLSFLKRTITEIASALKKNHKEHVIVIRSTIPPGTIKGVLTPILKEAGVADQCFMGMYPEFLREGSAVHDFFDPSLNILGCDKGFPVEIINQVFSSVQQELLVTNIKTAEAIKYANNTFHALKIAFTNEFSLFCKAYGVNSEEVMELFCKDNVLNISPNYLRPGFAFGGSCLPKDIKGLITLARAKSIETPLFKAALESNAQLIRRLIALIYDFEITKVGFLGITFKPNTDDIRESPVLQVIEKLLSRTPTYRKKFELYIFDHSKVLPKFRTFYNGQIVIAESEKSLAASAELIVLGPFKIQPETEEAIIDSGKPVIDLKWHKVSPRLCQYKQYYSIV